MAGVQVGVLTRWVRPDLVDEVLAQAGEAAGRDGWPGGRRFRALPGRLGVYFVLGLCLFSGLPYREVLRELAGGLSGPLRAAGWQVPASTALTKLRRRLGEKPFELLFCRLRGSLSPGRSPWSHIGGLLAVAWDGTTVRAPASPANVAAFGRQTGAPQLHHPQLRLVTLIACGTRGLLGAAIGPLRGCGERTLAAGLLGCLGTGMLLLADRGFYSFRLWTATAGTGAQLLWRVTASLRLPAARPLPDGSWLSVIADPAAVRARSRRRAKRRRRGTRNPRPDAPLPAIIVRVIEFWLTVTAGDGAVRAERYRLVTTLTDWQAYPAAQLARGYAWRWAAETGFAEVKTYLRGPGRILRGRTPDLARQELWAYLAIYQALRAIIALAAAGAGLDPGQISFTAALHAVRRTLTTARTTPDAALAEAEASILTALIPQRTGRVCVRAVTRPLSPYPARGTRKGPISQHADYSVTIHHPTQTTPTHPDQDRPPCHPANRPP